MHVSCAQGPVHWPAAQHEAMKLSETTKPPPPTPLGAASTLSTIAAAAPDLTDTPKPAVPAPGCTSTRGCAAFALKVKCAHRARRDRFVFASRPSRILGGFGSIHRDGVTGKQKVMPPPCRAELEGDHQVDGAAVSGLDGNVGARGNRRSAAMVRAVMEPRVLLHGGRDQLARDGIPVQLPHQRDCRGEGALPAVHAPRAHPACREQPACESTSFSGAFQASFLLPWPTGCS